MGRQLIECPIVVARPLAGRTRQAQVMQHRRRDRLAARWIVGRGVGSVAAKAKHIFELPSGKIEYHGGKILWNGG